MKNNNLPQRVCLNQSCKERFTPYDLTAEKLCPECRKIQLNKNKALKAKLGVDKKNILC